jgi:hypothetical protein
MCNIDESGGYKVHQYQLLQQKQIIIKDKSRWYNQKLTLFNRGMPYLEHLLIKGQSVSETSD